MPSDHEQICENGKVITWRAAYGHRRRCDVKEMFMTGAQYDHGASTHRGPAGPGLIRSDAQQQITCNL